VQDALDVLEFLLAKVDGAPLPIVLADKQEAASQIYEVVFSQRELKIKGERYVILTLLACLRYCFGDGPLPLSKQHKPPVSDLIIL
jgi:hypothetical protein